MPVYSWRKRPTKHFGQVWVPFAHIHIGGPEQRFQAFAVQIDSGATVSLLKRSVADLLGVSIESGREIDLTGVGGAQTTAFVHELPVRFEGWPLFVVPFAISSVESVPNLLGRLGIFDQLQIDFDASVQETSIATRWLDDDDRRLWRFFLETEDSILSRWDQIELAEPAKTAAKIFVRRAGQLTAGAAGLVKLHRSFEGPLIIRSLLELAVQFVYLMQDPQNRSQQYLDFKHVTKYQQLNVILDDPRGIVGETIANSPLRKEGEPRIKAEFERVRPRFLRKNGKKLWNNWYGMQIGHLAEHVGWDAEYRRWYAWYSGWAHADPFSSERDSLVVPNQVLLECYKYYGRMLLEISKELILTEEEYEFLRACSAESL